MSKKYSKASHSYVAVLMKTLYISFMFIWTIMICSIISVLIEGDITGNLSSYDMADWIVMIYILALPYIFTFYLIYKKSKKRKFDNIKTINRAKKSMPVKPLQTPVSNSTKPAFTTPTTSYADKTITTCQQKNSSNIMFDKIPKNISDLLWIYGKNCTDPNEPSAIDLSLPISSVEIDKHTSIGYYPNYRALSPAQRFCYLKWLEDISQPIDIGYVFIFYYGLERHLFFGDFVNAYATIKILQTFHDNGSFQAYSTDALLIAAAYHKRYDLLDNINFSNLAPAVTIYLKHNLHIPINSNDLINVRKQVGFTNDRYIKENYDKFKDTMDDILVEKYSTPIFPLTDAEFEMTQKCCPMILANYSLSQRISVIPDITQNSEFATKALELLQETHERYKINKRKDKSSK